MWLAVCLLFVAQCKVRTPESPWQASSLKLHTAFEPQYADVLRINSTWSFVLSCLLIVPSLKTVSSVSFHVHLCPPHRLRHYTPCASDRSVKKKCRFCKTFLRNCFNLMKKVFLLLFVVHVTLFFFCLSTRLADAANTNGHESVWAMQGFHNGRLTGHNAAGLSSYFK